MFTPTEADVGRKLWNGIFQGTYIECNVSDDDLISTYYPQLLIMCRQITPFKTDRLLISTLQVQSKDLVGELRAYFIKLQATMTYEPYYKFTHDTYEQVIPADIDGHSRTDQRLSWQIGPKPRINIVNELSEAEAHGTKYQIEAYKQLIAGTINSASGRLEKIASIQVVSGDGNCYFRAVLRSHLEQVIMSDNPNRAQWLDHMAKLIEDDVNLFPGDYTGNRVQELVSKLRSAALECCWTSLQEFWRDMADNTDNGDDYILIKSFRYILTHYLEKHMMEKINEFDLSLKDILEASELSPEKMLADLNTMGLETEGYHVEIGLLSAMIGTHQNNIVISRNEDINVVWFQPVDKILSQEFISENKIDGLPTTTTNLRLKPGHYDYFYTETQQSALILAQQTAPFIPPYLYSNFIENLVHHVDRIESSQKQLLTSIRRLPEPISKDETDKLITDLKGFITSADDCLLDLAIKLRAQQALQSIEQAPRTTEERAARVGGGGCSVS